MLRQVNGQIKATHRAHHNVRYYDAGLKCGENGNRLLCAVDGTYVKVLVPEDQGVAVGDDLLIIHDQNTRLGFLYVHGKAGEHPPASITATGRFSLSHTNI